MEQDLHRIRETVRIFFAAFTTAGGRPPDLDSLAAVCTGTVSFLHRHDEALTAYTLATFLDSRRERLSNGALLDFQEGETAGETRLYGGLAQHASRYEKRGLLDGRPFHQTGRKLFLLVRSGQDWKIGSMVWEDDA